MEKRYGYLIYPISGERIENVWMYIKDDEIFLEAPFSLTPDSEIELLNGVFNGLDKVTFVNVKLSGGNWGSGGAFRKLIVSFLIKHKHFKSLNELKFKQIGLSEFAFKRWFNEKVDLTIENNTVTIPRDLTLLNIVFDEFNLSWIIGYKYSLDSQNLTVKLMSCFVFKFVNETDLRSLIALILKLKKLIIFLTGFDPKFENFWLDKELELQFHVPKLSETRFPSNVILMYLEVKHLLPSIFKTWFENDKLTPITDLFLEKHFHDAIPHYRHFFNLVVGLEAYHVSFIHKNMKSTNPLNDSNRKEILNAIENNSTLTQWFSDKSSGWNNPTLNERFSELKETIEHISSGVFDFDTAELIQKIKNTRDKIAHAGVYNTRFKTSVELSIVTKIIELVLYIEILKLFKVELNNSKNDLIKSANFIVRQLARMNNFKID